MDIPSKSTPYDGSQHGGSVPGDAFGGNKSLMGQTIFGADSGYSSTADNLSEQNSSFYRNSSSYLQPIFEDVELKSFNANSSSNCVDILTPTSKSIQKINLFHITTPKSATKTRQLTPIKRSLKRPFDENSPHTEQSLGVSLQCTPKKCRIDKNYSHEYSFNEKLSHKMSFDENSENSSSMVEWSPIHSVNKSVRKNVLQETQNKFERKLSENSLQSSTPYNNNYVNLKATVPSLMGSSIFPRSKSMALSPKSRVIRKIQTSSPKKIFKTDHLIREFDRSVSAVDELLECETKLHECANPAKKLLTFSDGNFKDLISGKPSKAAEQTETSTLSISRHESIVDAFEPSQSFQDLFTSKSSAQRSLKRQNAFDSSFLSSPNSSMDLERKSTEDVDFSAISMELTPKKICSGDQTSLNCVGKKSTVFYHSSIEEDESCNGSRASEMSRHHCTPKKVRRSLSLHQYDPQKELNRMLYSHLPCTPPKKHRKSALKRTLTSASSTDSAAKRKLINEFKPKFPPKRNYSGVEKLDILYLLSQTVPAIDLILHYCNKDIENVFNVSKRWRNIVEQNSKAITQLFKIHKKQALNKENGGVLPKQRLLRLQPSLDISEEKITRPPFARTNSIQSNKNTMLRCYSAESTTEHGTIGGNLLKIPEENEQIIKCPHCCQTSIAQISKINLADKMAVSQLLSQSVDNKCPETITALRATTSHHENMLSTAQNNMSRKSSATALIKKSDSCPVLLPFRKQQTFDWMDEDMDNCSRRPSNKRHNSNKDESQWYKYAKCSKCSYRFCVKCLCDHLPNKCYVIEAKNVSISRHDQFNNGGGVCSKTVACTKQSRRNLKRLDSLEK